MVGAPGQIGRDRVGPVRERDVLGMAVPGQGDDLERTVRENNGPLGAAVSASEASRSPASTRLEDLAAPDLQPAAGAGNCSPDIHAGLP